MLGGEYARVLYALMIILFFAGLSFAESCAPSNAACNQAPEYRGCCIGTCPLPSGGTCPQCALEGELCGSSNYGLSCCGGSLCQAALPGNQYTCQAPVPSGSGTNWYDNIYAWVALAVAASASFIGLSYMVGKLLEMQVLEAWAKIEVQELAATVIIAVFCVSMIASVDAAASFLVGKAPGSTNIGVIASNTIDAPYFDGQALYKALSKAYYGVARWASYSYTVGINAYVMSTSYSSSPGSGLYALASDIGGSMDSVANFMLFLAAQKSFVIFFVNAATVMLPVGIFLRAFSITRKVGSTILAATIAAAVVFPASYLISGELYGTFRPDLRTKTNSIQGPAEENQNPPMTGLVCSPWMSAFIASPLALATNFIGGKTNALGGAGGLVTQVGSALLGGELGWSITICFPICAATTVGWGACVQSCFRVVEVVFVLTKGSFNMAMAPFLSSYGADFSKISGLYDNLRAFALPAVSQYAVLNLVFALIPIIMAISMIRGFAALFGGEAHLYGLSKLV